MTPRVSVVVPTRDRLDSLRRALAGVAGQSFRDFEVLVVDDGSVDGTATWLRDHHPGVRVLSTERSAGAAAARNRGVEQARGELIAFLDDDDVWRPSYLDAQVRNLDANPAAALSYAAHLEIDRSNGHTAMPDTAPLFAYESTLVRLCAEAFIHTMSVVVCRRDLFERVGGFDEQLTIVHDFDWYCRILRGGGSFTHVPDVLVARAIPGGLVTRHRAWFEEEREVLSRTLAGVASDRLVRAYRSLFFARLGLGRGDLAFGVTRLGAAIRHSPHWTMAIAAHRLLRRVRSENGSPIWAAAA